MSDTAGKKGWRTILGGVTEPVTGAPVRQPKQPDAEDYIAHIRSAEDAVMVALDRAEDAVATLHAAQRAFAAYVTAQEIDVTVTPKIFTIEQLLQARQAERTDG